MEQEFPVDIDEIRLSVERAEAVAIFFPYVRKTLLLDTRHTVLDPPVVRVMPMVASARDRMESVRRMRPRLGPLESLAFIPWARSVASVKELGVWQLIVDRMAGAAGRGYEVALERCYRELLREERCERRRAVTGEGYETLWERVY